MYGISLQPSQDSLCTSSQEGGQLWILPGTWHPPSALTMQGTLGKWREKHTS